MINWINQLLKYLSINLVIDYSLTGEQKQKKNNTHRSSDAQTQKFGPISISGINIVMANNRYLLGCFKILHIQFIGEKKV